MRIRALVLAVAVLSAAPVAAAPVWTAPGWYQVADTIVGPFVWKGPFPDQASCQAVLPPNEEDADYACEYLDSRPSWDD
jgi:hypothetical protein